VYRTHYQPSAASDKDTRRLKIESSVKPIRRSQDMKTGFNRDVRSVNVDRSVA
jgi:hypothetical protein